MTIIQAFEEISEDLIDNQDVFEEHEEALAGEIEAAGEEVVLANEAIDNQLRTLHIAIEAYDDFTSNRISFDQFKYSVFATETAIYGKGTPQTALVTEAAVLDRMANAITGILSAIKVSFSKTADYLQYAYSWFSLQRSATMALRSKLTRVRGDSAVINIGVNKYMRFGKNHEIVRDMGEYSAKYREMAKAMIPFTSAIADLAEEDLFSGLKLFKEGLTGDPEKWFEDRFYSVERNLKRAMSGVSSSVHQSNAKYTEYKSPVLLGLSSITVRLPNKALYRKGEYEELFGAHRYFYAYVDRSVKIKFSTLLDGSLNHFQVKKSDLIKNLDESMSLIESALKLTSFSARLSNEGAVIDGASYIFGKRKAEEGFNGGEVFETVMFYRRICAMLYDSVSSAYNFSLGNVKQMNRIAKKSVEKM